ncbi:protein ANTAGONIST OF LIKE HETEROCHROMATIN PROTEIN 1-like [Ischnura elegans]|uniref:protein ANTAGONIST OF LIKE HETEROCHROMATIN PROTEIN 1-like n=1 Tax=Ischnura elegans TaxID=197161 RepID=UPI001ED87F74|nr:protein ANTAGONIST OF LIKE HETEROCHROMATIN PROTEIN 1-like [Ischnura elegans]
MSNKKRRILAFLLSEEEDDDDIAEKIIISKRKSEHQIYKTRSEEGYSHMLIENHLRGDSEKFCEFFRLNPSQINFILSLIEDDIRKINCNRHPYPIRPDEKLALTLRFLATGESYHSLRFQFRISAGEISKIVASTLSVLREKLMPLYLPPLSPEEVLSKTDQFYQRWNFPNCAGAIDGKHIRIVCPSKTGSLFFNYKGYFSIVLLALVDANYKFMYIDVGSYGKEGDSGIFDRSDIGKKIATGSLLPLPRKLPNSDKVLPCVLVGDEAFRLHTNMMRPYPRTDAAANERKAIFNYRLSRARRVSENAFGLLSQTFRIFYTPIHLLPSRVDDAIIVSCCLHNLLRDDFISSHGKTNCDFEPAKDLPCQNLISLAGTGGFANQEGFSVRDSFADYFIGEAPHGGRRNLIQETGLS